MITKEKQIEKAFRIGLQKLLDDFNAEISVDNYYQGYPECGEDIRATVYIPAVYDETGCIQEVIEFTLDRYMHPEKY